jgi:hypothetical protein
MRFELWSPGTRITHLEMETGPVPRPRPFSRGGSRGLVLTSSRQRSYAPLAHLAWGVPDPRPSR